MTEAFNLIGRDKDHAYRLIQDLTAQFHEYRDAYLEPQYLESQARADFIDKFWMALGWDVLHLEQTNPYKQEVRIELSHASETGRKRPDYSFFLEPEFRDPCFLVEAKRPGVDADNVDCLVQAARYGWYGGLPIVALHNFVELVVLDSRYRADANGVARRVVARFHYSSLGDEDAFSKLYWLFSREAVAGGSISAFVGQLPATRRAPTQHGLFQGGYRAVDVALLDTLEEWRSELARSLKNRNNWLDGPTLTEVTQRILDRLVMIRFLQDKEIETRIGIETIAKKGEAWSNFQKASRQLDGVYNGIVFKHHPLVDGSRLHVDDSVFLSICDELDPTGSSVYNFAQIPIQILGSIYERFLGKVIETTAQRAKIVDRPEAIKAGGIYYTPTHVVHYIVDATLNPIVKGKKFSDLLKLRIIDSACGSGSFLIAVFDKLITAAAEWFNANPQRARDAGCVPVGNGWRLSLHQKRQLLVSCIFGSDLDHQAVEVAQLSLFLKLLEEETAGSAKASQHEIEQALLPSLAYNTIVANALIDTDFYDNEIFPEDDLKLRPTAFKRKFAKVFEKGGFDAIVGNPPYLFITELSNLEKDYFQRRYTTTEYRFDIYGLFLERAVTELLKPGGRLGYIIPHTLLANESFTKARKLLLTESYLHEVLDIGPGVFQRARNETMILVIERAAPGRRKTMVRVTTAKTFPLPHLEFQINQSQWEGNRGAAWLVNVNPDAAKLLSAMDGVGRTLGDLCTVNQGLRTGDNEAFLSTEFGGPKWERAAGGAEIKRYQPIQDGLWVLYDPPRLDAPRKRELFDRPEKIVVQEIRNISLAQRIVATLDRKRTFCLQSTNVIGLKRDCTVDLRFIMGVISSAVMNRYFRLLYPANNHIASNQLASLPIPRPTAQEERRIASWVDQLLNAQERLATTNAESQREALQAKCITLDEAIEQAVCNLFGVSPEMAGS